MWLESETKISKYLRIVIPASIDYHKLILIIQYCRITFQLRTVAKDLQPPKLTTYNPQSITPLAQVNRAGQTRVWFKSLCPISFHSQVFMSE